MPPVEERPVEAADEPAPDTVIRGAALEHAHVAEGEVVFDGIRRVEAGEVRGDLGGGAPRDVVPVGEAEVLAELVDVCVHRDEERGRRDRPEAEIDAVGGADHPP